MKARKKAAGACGATWVLALLAPAVATSAFASEPARPAATGIPSAGEDAVMILPAPVGGPQYVPALDDYFHPDRFRSRAGGADAGAAPDVTPAGESPRVVPGVAQRPAVLPLPTGLALGAAGLGTLAGLRAGRRVIAMSRIRVRIK